MLGNGPARRRCCPCLSLECCRPWPPRSLRFSPRSCCWHWPGSCGASAGVWLGTKRAACRCREAPWAGHWSERLSTGCSRWVSSSFCLFIFKPQNAGVCFLSYAHLLLASNPRGTAGSLNNHGVDTLLRNAGSFEKQIVVRVQFRCWCDMCGLYAPRVILCYGAKTEFCSILPPRSFPLCLPYRKEFTSHPSSPHPYSSRVFPHLQIFAFLNRSHQLISFHLLILSTCTPALKFRVTNC